MIIKKPYIEKRREKTCLCAKIVLPNGEKIMYFEVENRWAEYLCDETADAFLIGLLNYAMSKGYGVKCEAPITARLLYQVKTYVIPTLGSGVRKGCKRISIDAPIYMGEIRNASAVGTSASGGVDSFYTISRHTRNNVSKQYKLTHLLIANQFNIYKDETSTRQKFENLIIEQKPIAENYGLDFIGMYTNHHEFMFNGFVQEYSFRICSYVLALQKLFHVYYVSSGVAFRDFDFNNHDSDGSDAFNLPLVSTNGLTFYSSGGERMRSDKIAYFVDDPYIQKKLYVCNTGGLHNCNQCEKCLRTMTSLDILGKLHLYNQTFDVEEYQKRKKKFYGRMLADEYEASLDLKMFAKRRNFKFPLSSWIYAIIIRKPYLIFKRLLSSNKLIRRLYYRFNIDVLRFGKEMAMVYRYGTEEDLY